MIEKRYVVIAPGKKAGTIDAWIIATDVDELIAQMQQRRASIELRMQLEDEARHVYAHSFLFAPGQQYALPGGLLLLVDRAPA
jgi:hypothetical protein